MGIKWAPYDGWWVPFYDSWKTTEPKPWLSEFYICEHCEEPFYIGEEAYQVDAGYVHEDCLDEYLRKTHVLSVVIVEE